MIVCSLLSAAHSLVAAAIKNLEAFFTERGAEMMQEAKRAVAEASESSEGLQNPNGGLWLYSTLVCRSTRMI